MTVEALGRNFHPVVLVAVAVEQVVVRQRPDPVLLPLQLLEAPNNALALLVVVDRVEELEALDQVPLLLDDALQLRQDLLFTDLQKKRGQVLF